MLLGDVLYINKEKTTSWTESIGQQWPEALSISGPFEKNIPTEKELVKLKEKPPEMYQNTGGLKGDFDPNTNIIS